jgi:hypothetical protein
VRSRIGLALHCHRRYFGYRRGERRARPESDKYATSDRRRLVLLDLHCDSRSRVARPVPPHLPPDMRRLVERLGGELFHEEELTSRPDAKATAAGRASVRRSRPCPPRAPRVDRGGRPALDRSDEKPVPRDHAEIDGAPHGLLETHAPEVDEALIRSVGPARTGGGPQGAGPSLSCPHRLDVRPDEQSGRPAHRQFVRRGGHGLRVRHGARSRGLTIVQRPVAGVCEPHARPEPHARTSRPL